MKSLPNAISVPTDNQVVAACALWTVCGFSIGEIAALLHMQKDTVRATLRTAGAGTPSRPVP